MYRGVCATCHSLNRIAFRNMDGVCYTTEELKEMASEVRRHMLLLSPAFFGDRRHLTLSILACRLSTRSHRMRRGM